MITLAFDTAMGAGSVVVDQDGETLAHRAEPNPRALAEQLVPMIEATLADAGQAYQTIDRIGVTTGPGTFTGMRIGMAAARAMALASQKPLIGVSTLEVVAQQAALDGLDSGTITTCFDARRGEVYLQSFNWADDVLTPREDPAIYQLEQALDKMSQAKGTLVGNGAGLLSGLSHLTCLEKYDQIEASVLAQIVAQRPVPDDMPLPLYLRAPDAKLPGGKTLGAP